MSTTPSILMVLTSHAELGSTGRTTGFWLEELAAPYAEFKKAGARIDLASPKGGRPAADPGSEKDLGEAARAFLADADAVKKLDNTIRLDAVKERYDAIFLVGGHGTMWDLATDASLARLLADTFEDGRVVAAVCHGPAGLTSVRLRNGEPLVKGRRVTGFSDEEETVMKLMDVVPFPLETRLRELGAVYERGPIWKSHAVRDGRLVTGQNPASSVDVARQTLAAIAG